MRTAYALVTVLILRTRYFILTHCTQCVFRLNLIAFCPAALSCCGTGLVSLSYSPLPLYILPLRSITNNQIRRNKSNLIVIKLI